jgi:alpha-glucosidase (family GH31 glycosyl hydrolase)
MPPYWALGFQISRYGYENLDDMKDVLKRFQQHNIPLVNLDINDLKYKII